jgi:predicted acylesterase/phospholipase RssA
MAENPPATPDPTLDRKNLNRVPAQACDLIMKGGVTSGIVYPPGILQLCQQYRFHSIGGASAGAIAAAAAAAAEYGRQTPPASPSSTSQGFVRLAEMNDELAKPGFIRSLFRPSPEGEPLLQAILSWQHETATALQQGTPPAEGARPPGWLTKALAWMERLDTVLEHSVKAQHRAGSAVGLLGAALLASGLGAWGVVWLLTPGFWPRVLGVVLLGLTLGLCWVGTTLGGLLGGGWALLRTVLRLQDKDVHKYGLCPGSDGPTTRLASQHLALTDWLHVRLNELAGLEPEAPPLTLRQLRERGICFKLVTSNLTLGQPYILPMTRGSRSFFFKKSEMERLFPPPVVKALVEWGKTHRPKQSICLSDEDAKEFLRFPMGEDIPLVVATRLSLSFPVLLSAVRLYSIRSEAYVPLHQYGPPRLVDLTQDVEEHWLSDGGIASNFPIHIFDTWVPARPTFGITLYDSPLSKVLHQREASADASVLLPYPRDFDKSRPQRTAINGLADFLRAIFQTAQSFRDNAQSGLPSYRERIVQVFLDQEEGGLNLDMRSHIVQQVQAKGRQAARLLLERYPSIDSPSFAEHRWVRLQVLMAELERHLLEIRKLFPDGDWKLRLQESIDALFQEQLGTRAKSEGEPWYRPKDEAWCQEASKRIGALLTLIESWDLSHQEWQQTFEQKGKPRPQVFFSEHPPRPEGILKVTPNL